MPEASTCADARCFLAKEHLHLSDCGPFKFCSRTVLSVQLAPPNPEGLCGGRREVDGGLDGNAKGTVHRSGARRCGC